MKFWDQVKKIVDELEKLGHELYLPVFHKNVDFWKASPEFRANLKKKDNLIKKHYEKIKNSDAILVANFDKGEIKGYIGGNSFLEMGFAYILGKKIYLLNPIPQMHYRAEIMAMEPIIIKGDLTKIR